jgi:adenylate cyclase
MPLEVERKFLLPEAPGWLGDHPATEVEQGYLVIAGELEVRLRAADGHRLLTVKRGHGEVREEVEIQLSAEQFDALWPLTEGQRISKRRHVVPIDGLKAEVDVYGARLEGLVVAEIEFSSQEQAEGFQAPDWLGEEVTGDDRYANQSLATAGAPGRAG